DGVQLAEWLGGATILKKLSGLFGNRGEESVQPGFLRPIDTDRIARTLKLDTLGEDRGKKDMPPTDSTELDSVEQEVVQKLQSEWAWQGEEFLNQLRAYVDRLVQYSIKTEFNRLQLIAQ